MFCSRLDEKRKSYVFADEVNSRATPMVSDSNIVRLLRGSIREVLNVEPRPGGIGGGTFAALFRRKGIPAAVWQQECAGVAHQPDEYTEIDYIVNNAKVFASMMLGGL